MLGAVSIEVQRKKESTARVCGKTAYMKKIIKTGIIFICAVKLKMNIRHCGASRPASVSPALHPLL